jgi:predicted  nucleic acid-binding Zn-ribbon protein
MIMKNYVSNTRRQLTELNRLENEIANCQAEGRSTLQNEALKESLHASMSLSVVMLHDLLRVRGRQSVAEVRHGVCSGCHMALPSGLLAEVQRQTTLTKCETCGRFIFPAVEESAPTPPPETPKKKPISRRTAKP